MALSLVSSRNARRALKVAHDADKARRAADAAQARAAYLSEATRRVTLTERLSALSNDPERGPAVRAAMTYWTARYTWRTNVYAAMGADKAQQANWAHEDTGRSVVRTMLSLAAKNRADDAKWSAANLTAYNARQSAESRERRRKAKEMLASGEEDITLPAPARPAHNESALGLVAVVLAATTYADALPSWCAPWRVADLADTPALGGAMALVLPCAPPPLSPADLLLAHQADKAGRKADKAAREVSK